MVPVSWFMRGRKRHERKGLTPSITSRLLVQRSHSDFQLSVNHSLYRAPRSVLSFLAFISYANINYDLFILIYFRCVIIESENDDDKAECCE